MLSLLDPTTVPPGGFRYLQRETDALLTAPSMSELLTKVRNHRLANNLPLSLDWKLEIENWLCEQLPHGICRHNMARDIPLAPGERPMSVAQAINGARVLGAWMFKGFSKVSQAEADARSKTCAACPFNQPAEGCTVCASNIMREAVASVLGNSRTVAHDNLNTCNICGCTLKLAVWCPVELIHKHSPPNKNAPEWCWKK
jgi:hypothetical protein